MSVATVEPATFQLDASPSAPGEAEHLAAAVAHEHRGRAVGAQVVGQEAEAGETDAEGDRERDVVRMNRHGVDREVGAGDRCERRGEPVHVVEQVERVRHADEPDDADRRREDAVRDDLDADAHREHERGGGELCARALRAG